uniref:Very short patch repair endonuclease n=1 Tax=Candidatus Kentrum sp. LPFa TaxID=2126335 RepID=A0A450VPN1_9GAMM|nr:MAG: T/G mismatch-specific endonuclease [Candidatus Kentron sp. LPFa]VFK23400.1 MAG: T/G mismatch-specific endonuclease [Candidatus Kentron sp. LPFa]
MALSPDPSPTPERSRLMSRVKGADTKPEWIVRRLLHKMGYRYRLHRKDLPGTPDIVFIGRRKAIFVHGCFWHRHEGCRMTTTPKTRSAFWKKKFEANKERDRRKFRELDAMGWGYLVVWECETRNKEDLKHRLWDFLDQ